MSVCLAHHAEAVPLQDAAEFTPHETVTVLLADHPSYDTSRTIVSTSSTTLPTWRTSRESFMIRSSDVRRHEEARSSHLLPGLGRVGSASAVMHLMRHAD